jgi:hypothetical protein
MNGSDSHIGESVAISDDGSIIAIGAPGGKYTNHNRLGYVEIRELSEDGTSYTRRDTLIEIILSRNQSSENRLH